MRKCSTSIRMALFLICLLSWTPQTSLAQTESPDWNRFRGPNGSGVVAEAKIPVEFGPDKNVVWKTELPNGYSSPVFQDGRIYLTAEENETLYTICLDQSDGNEIWRVQAPRDRTEKLDPRNHAASPSPVVHGESVFVFFPDYGVIGYQTSDGIEKWRQPLGPFTNLYGMGASPVVVDGLVVLVCDHNIDSFLIAFDEDTGKVAWRTKREEATSGHCSPIVYRPNPDQPALIIVAGSFNLTAYESTRGDKIWWVRGLCFEMKSTPVMSDDTVYINGFGSPENEQDQSFVIPRFAETLTANDANGDGVLSFDEMPDDLAINFFPAVDLDNNQTLNEQEWVYYRSSIASKNSMMAIKLGGGTGDLTRQNTRWKYHKNIPQLPSPLLVGNQLLMISDRGIVTSLDPETGHEQYKGRLPGAAGSYYASPVAAGDKILFATTAGKIAVVQAGEKIDVLAVNDLDEEIYATPAIVGDQIFVRTDKALYCFGETETKLETPANDDSTEITFLANEGFLIKNNGVSVLIDAFVKDGYYGYGAIPNKNFQELVAGRPPFDNILLALTTHEHLDHFQVKPAIEFLKQNRQCHLLSTEQVVLKARHATDDEKTQEQLEIVWPEAGKTSTYQGQGVTVEAFPLRHANPRNYKIQNLGLLIKFENTTILHVGDAESRDENFEAYGLAGKKIDIAILPDWMLQDQEFLTRNFGADKYIAAHIPLANLKQAKLRFAKTHPNVFVFDEFMAQHRFKTVASE